LQFVVPGTLIIFDHWLGEIEILSDNPEQRVKLIKNMIPHNSLWGCNPKTKVRRLTKPHIKMWGIGSNFTQAEFESIVTQAKQHIAAGDIYQVNLSQRFEKKLNNHPFEIYKRLRQINPSPFASYFDFGDLKLISCSPERLINLENGIAETRPIAGTRPVAAIPEELLLDPKERAEHIMLVDLERNDLGKVCEYGSVHVDEMMTIEKYSHVIHIVSNVKGKLRKDKNQFDLIRAMFPGGTITGCPKIRSMEIIEELEPVKRGPYTGCIGYIMPNKMDLSITIRTIVVKKETAYIQAGAGIVADSIPEREYFETLHKAQAMLEACGGVITHT
jgi:anthranilate synthase component 1/para-aminobenzoate synthetase component 1